MTALEPNGPLHPRVSDKTGLTGKKYTFILEYDCPACAPLSTTSQLGSAPLMSDPDGFPDIFGALQKQLGLRLDNAADVPTDVIVVDSLDKIPTEN